MCAIGNFYVACYVHFRLRQNVAYTNVSGALLHIQLVVVDGKDGNGYDEMPGLGVINFDSANSFYYLARRENTILLVEEKIETK